MTAPVLLDLFAGVGGAGVGYQRAGFDVYAVDLEPMPYNPHPMHRGDALVVLDQLAAGKPVRFEHPLTGRHRDLTLDDLHAVHASPPCPAYSALAAVHGNEHPRLIEPTRERLAALGVPTIIENVQGSPLRRDLVLCGEMFGLDVIRHRYFELGGWSMPAPEHVKHRGRVRGWRHGVYYDGPYLAVHGDGGGKGTVAEWQRAMGIGWTPNRRDIANAIPPAYTELIGVGLLAELDAERAA